MGRLGALVDKVLCCGGDTSNDLDDSNVDAVIARNLWKNHKILPPTSKFKANWDLVMLLLVFYNCVYIPIELFFLGNGIVEHPDYPKRDLHEVIDYFVDFLFFCDMLVNSCTAILDEDYEMVLDRRQIIRHYASSGWLWIDLVACFPFELVLMIFKSPDAMPAGVFGMLKLPRLIRLLRVFKKLDVVAAANALRIVALMVLFCLIAHWFACMCVDLPPPHALRTMLAAPARTRAPRPRRRTTRRRHSHPVRPIPSPSSAPLAARSWWIIGWAEYRSDLNQTDGTSHGISWLSRIPGEQLHLDSPFEHQYLSAMYWSLTTLMKTPWVGPDTVGEKMFASLAVVMGAILFAALLGNVTALVQTFDKGNTQKRDKITTLHQFNASRKVPAVLQRKLFAYVDAEWTITSGLDDSSVLAQLPGQLRGNIVASIYKDTLLKAPLFSCCSLECAKSLLLRLQPEICLQKEVLIARDQLCQEVYLLMRGAMQVASDESDAGGGKDNGNGGDATSTTKKGALMFRMIEKPGSVIGHIDPFQREVPRYPFLVTAVRQAHLVSLSRVDVLDVLSNFEGDDCNSVLRVLREEHQNTVKSLTDKRGQAAGHAPGAAAPVSAEAAEAEAKEKAEQQAASDQTLQTLRTRVAAMEQKLAKCVDDMQVARECTEVLPHLVYLVNSAAQADGSLNS